MSNTTVLEQAWNEGDTSVSICFPVQGSAGICTQFNTTQGCRAGSSSTLTITISTLGWIAPWIEVRHCHRMQLLHEKHCLMRLSSSCFQGKTKQPIPAHQVLQLSNTTTAAPKQGHKTDMSQSFSVSGLQQNWCYPSLRFTKSHPARNKALTQDVRLRTSTPIIHRFTVSPQRCCKYLGFSKAQNFVWSVLGRKPRVDISSYSSIPPIPNFGSTLSSQVNNELSTQYKEKEEACEDFTIRT